MRFGEIGRNLFGDVLIVLLQTREAVDSRSARIDGLTGGRPLQKKRHRLIVSQRAERAKSGVTEEAVRRIGGDGGAERGERVGLLKSAKSLQCGGASTIGSVLVGDGIELRRHGRVVFEIAEGTDDAIADPRPIMRV